MIAKSLPAGSTKGTILYAGKKEGAELTVANDVFGSPEFITVQFRHVQELNTRTQEKNKTFSSTISLHPNDTNKLSKPQEIKLIQDYAKALNLDKNQYVAYKHTDTEVPHFHFIANLINETTEKSTTLSHYKLKHLTFCELQEKKYNLTVAVKPENIIPYKETTIIKNDNLQIDFLRIIIQQNLKKSKNFKDFQNRMQIDKIKVYLNGSGVSFITHDKSKFSGSKISRKFSFKGIEKQISDQVKKNPDLYNKPLTKVEKSSHLDYAKIAKGIGKPAYHLDETTKKRLYLKAKNIEKERPNKDLGKMIKAFNLHKDIPYKNKTDDILRNPNPIQAALEKKFDFELTPKELKIVKGILDQKGVIKETEIKKVVTASQLPDLEKMKKAFIFHKEINYENKVDNILKNPKSIQKALQKKFGFELTPDELKIVHVKIENEINNLLMSKNEIKKEVMEPQVLDMKKVLVAFDFHKNNGYKNKVDTILKNPKPLQASLEKKFGFKLTSEEIEIVHEKNELLINKPLVTEDGAKRNSIEVENSPVIAKTHTKKPLTSEERIAIGVKVHSGKYKHGLKIKNLLANDKPLNNELKIFVGIELTSGEIKEVYKRTKALNKGKNQSPSI